jgi:hypothetical protein
MSGDGATIHSQDAANALGSYDGAAELLKANYQARAAAVLKAYGDGSWIGDGDAAEAFRKNFKPADVMKFLDHTAKYDPKAKEQSQTGGAIVGGVANLGTTARQAIEQSLGADQQQADEMKKAQRKASVGAHDSGPSGSTGTSTGAPSSRSGKGSPGTGSGATEQRTQAVQDAVLLQSGTTGTTGKTGKVPTTARRDVLANHPLQPLDRPLPGQPGHVTSHEATRDNVLPNQPLQPLDRPLPGQPGHVTSHEATRDDVLPTQPVSRVTSHETTRDNVLPGHEGTNSQTPADTARTPHHVTDRHPIIDNEVAPQTTQAPGRNKT